MPKKLRHIDKIRKQQRKKERKRAAYRKRLFEPAPRVIPNLDEYFKYGLSEKGFK